LGEKRQIGNGQRSCGTLKLRSATQETEEQQSAAGRRSKKVIGPGRYFSCSWLASSRSNILANRSASKMPSRLGADVVIE
jgi:hypothetical protein